MEVKVSAAHGDSHSHLPRILRGEVAHLHMVCDGDSFYMREQVPSSLDRSFQNLVSWASEPIPYHTPFETILSRSRTKRTALRSLYTGSSITMMRVFNLLELFLNGSLKNNTSIVPVWLSKYSNKFYIYCFLRLTVLKRMFPRTIPLSRIVIYHHLQLQCSPHYVYNLTIILSSNTHYSSTLS